jgi:hypothetical protein
MVTLHSETNRLGMTWLPAYKRVRELYKERPGAIFVDIGCGCERPKLITMADHCFDFTYKKKKVGQDLRKLSADGWPAENLVAVDVREGTYFSSSLTSRNR